MDEWETNMRVPLSEAIDQLRHDLRGAILEGGDKDIVFVPKEIELELVITFATEVKAGGGFKLLAFLDLSTEAKASDSHQHRIKLKLEVSDKDGNSLKVRATTLPRGL
jgi:hypothetical protein